MILGKRLLLRHPNMHVYRAFPQQPENFQSEQSPSGSIATEEQARAGDTKTSSLIPGISKCHTDGSLALESWRNCVTVRFWAHLGHTRNRYLGKCPCTQYVTGLDSRENPHMGFGFLGDGFLN